MFGQIGSKIAERTEIVETDTRRRQKMEMNKVTAENVARETGQVYKAKAEQGQKKRVGSKTRYRQTHDSGKKT